MNSDTATHESVMSASVTSQSVTSRSGTPAIEIEKVSHRLGGKQVIDDLSLSIPSGALYGLIGPNGSGKTTTMRLILRIYNPDSGSVRVFGQQGGRSDQLRIGYLPEERGLYPRMSVEKILHFFGKIRGVPDPKAEMKRWLERLGVEGWAGKKVEQLSKGMGQKVQFIAAVMGQPRLVILDEPFSGLDPVNLDLLRDNVKQLRDEGTTVILSTHDMEVAQGMCDSVMMIYGGRKVLDGTLSEIREGYGGPRVRVRFEDGQAPPNDLPGIGHVVTTPTHHDLILDDLSKRSEVLQRLAQAGPLAHFETVRPSLHDIFVDIAGDRATSNPTPASDFRASNGAEA
ncbi:MAG: ATP-binding cassette domain-containing protein [Planctomycetota bacterium]